MVLLGTEVAAFSDSDKTMTPIPELTVGLNSYNNPKNSVFISVEAFQAPLFISLARLYNHLDAQEFCFLIDF